jgi:hypothetical protein
MTALRRLSPCFAVLIGEMQKDDGARVERLEKIISEWVVGEILE